MNAQEKAKIKKHLNKLLDATMNKYFKIADKHNVPAKKVKNALSFPLRQAKENAIRITWEDSNEGVMHIHSKEGVKELPIQ